MEEIIYIIALSLGSIVTIFMLAKLMGYRQMSQMSMFDYISGITIGSIAAEMATSLEENFVQPLTAMIVYGRQNTIHGAVQKAGSSGAKRFRERGGPGVLVRRALLLPHTGSGQVLCLRSTLPG